MCDPTTPYHHSFGTIWKLKGYYIGFKQEIGVFFIFFYFFLFTFEGGWGCPWGCPILCNLGPLMCDPMPPLALAPPLVSTEATWPKDLIASRNFQGFFKKTMILVILAILAIEEGQGPPFGGAEYSLGLSQGPSDGPSPFYQPHTVFSLSAPHTFLSRDLK